MCCDSHATGKDVAAAVRTYDDMLANGLTADDKTLSNMVIAHSWESTKDMTRSALASLHLALPCLALLCLTLPE